MPSATEVKKKLERAQAWIRNRREQGTAVAETAFSIAEIGGSAFLMAYARERFGENGALDLVGVDAALIGSMALHGLGFAGFFGKHDSHVHAVANGLLAEYAVTKGQEFGREARQESGGAQGVAGPARMNPRQPHAAQSIHGSMWDVPAQAA